MSEEFFLQGDLEIEEFKEQPAVKYDDMHVIVWEFIAYNIIAARDGIQV